MPTAGDVAARLQLQRVGREVPALRRRRAAVGRAGPRASGMTRRPVPAGARGRLDRGRRRRHAGHHRAVPAAPQPQPGAVAGARSSRCCVERARRRTDRVAADSGWSRTRDTDGHVDNWSRVRPTGRDAARRAARPGRTRTTSDCEENRSVLAAAHGSRASSLDVGVLPYAEVGGETASRCRYLNLYLCNGGVIVPVVRADPADDEALEIIGGAIPRARGRGRAGRGARLRRRRAALHHPAGAR